MRWLMSIVATLAAAPAAGDVLRPDGTVITCYCTDSTGGRVEMGERACLTIGQRRFTAQCAMSLNVPIWREVAEGCEVPLLSLRRPELGEPSLDAGAVDPEV